MNKNNRGFCPNRWRCGTRKVDQPSRYDPAKMEKNSPVEADHSEMKIIIPTVSVATSIPPKPENIPCNSGACKSSRMRSDPRPESPWHILKTIFLIVVVVALIIWVIVYTLLVQYQIL
ncbi:uncharacterized protein LOC117172568 isoform X2 [Belonocnema kinseyi]|uniref:uncharacterized protein LOC117172568 isoform X2 n=1 Tax=Belonocnema kinseyi TaxID=2817044 RepID=UPI00143D8103|nr:uncharacterized protein LOC117172568 isoform X2 [Belonocnema kinseyi]